MTDTITLDTVERTIASLTTQVEQARERLVTEAADYTAKRDHMVQVAHQRGTANSIGSALDDLLEEFDLPRRRPSGWFRALVRVEMPFTNNGGSAVTLDNGQYVYPVQGRLSFLLSMEYTLNMTPDSETCLCDDPVAAVRTWLPYYYGTAVVAAGGVTFQIAEDTCCGISGCPSPRMQFDARTAIVDWATRPIHHLTPPVTPTA